MEPILEVKKERDPRGRKNKSGIPYGYQEKEYYAEFARRKCQQVTCICGCELSNLKLARHMGRKIHQKNMEKLAKNQNN
jgi:hypothetical protein